MEQAQQQQQKAQEMAAQKEQMLTQILKPEAKTRRKYFLMPTERALTVV
jgi:DNA-binding TFAR19-related protein (PDSD5 family)